MKQISLGKQAEIVKATIPQPYPIEFMGETIEINPVLGLNQKKDFMDIVWSLYYNADKDGNYDFRPYTFDFSIRIATIYCYTNIKIDFEQDIDKYYLLAQYSGLYEAIVESLSRSAIIYVDHETLVQSARDYINLKCDELSDIRAFSAKSQIDTLLESVLTKASDMLDGFKDENGKVNIKDILAAVSDVKKLADQDDLVGKILNFRDKQEGGETTKNEHRAESESVPEFGGGTSKD